MAIIWKRNAGRIMNSGDSITAGYMAQTGGWLKKLKELLEDANIIFTFVGPYTDGATGIKHMGFSGNQAAIAKADFDYYVTTYAPDVINVAYGVNDAGTALSSSSTIQDDLGVIFTKAKGVKHCAYTIQSLVRPGSGHAYYAQVGVIDDVNTAMPAFAEAQGATYVDIGAPTTSDGLHPDDGITGYDSMGIAQFNGLLAAIP